MSVEIMKIDKKVFNLIKNLTLQNKINFVFCYVLMDTVKCTPIPIKFFVM